MAKGFGLLETLFGFTILLLLFVFSTPYLFGTREKMILETERDKIANSLELAQQNAIAAYKGYDYTIEFDKDNNQYVLQPEGKTNILHPKIEIFSVDPSEITFFKLIGKPDSSLQLTLVSKNFECQILVNSEGVITVTNSEKR